MNTYRRIVLAERPRGEITSQCFRLETVPVPDLKPGQILVKNHFLSLDPYMRGRMSERKSYANPQALNETMIGGTVGEVIASENQQWQIGDRVAGMFGWSELEFLQNTEGSAIRRIGYRRWQRNIAVALGNAPASEQIMTALQHYSGDAQVQRHVDWALEQHRQRFQLAEEDANLRKVLRKNERLIRIIQTGLSRDAT